MFAEPGGAGGPGALAPKDFLFGWRRRRLGRVRELRSGFDLLLSRCVVNWEDDKEVDPQTCPSEMLLKCLRLRERC